MEYIWYIIAALGAGIGTGLAGLSAATVMVPIVIVLCPSFAGETGAYHATAIALASDILGSAFTTGIYIKHKNIDLRRGWIMLACIVGMCIAGSFAAFAVGHVVLGGFSLFLCVGIGIRFLLKPDTQRERTVQKGARLDGKGVLISLFFGLTIGFGTGFVGSGGGMMMLVVFTAFLGMDRKSAVGTSTFIMTFTALIAFVSHAAIDPAILLERWDALLICIVTATAGSILSAQFANKVNNKVVGLVTGAILTVLGIVLLLFNYWDFLSRWAIVGQTLRCLGRYLLFLAAVVAVIAVLRLVFHVKGEWARKLLQFPAMTSVIFMLYAAETWHAAVLCAVLFCLAVYPILHRMEKWPPYAKLLMERKSGEVKKSLLLLFGTHCVLAAVCCGLLHRPYIAVAAILTWGIADTAAALVGKRVGKHPIRLPHADPHKTWEGSAAMAVTSAVTGALTLLLVSPLPWWMCVVFSVAAAPFSAAAELYAHNGNDTVTVPVVVAAVLALLCQL
ncbi:MAG: TSUP family transporter [Oscillospiraceae bacterium]